MHLGRHARACVHACHDDWAHACMLRFCHRAGAYAYVLLALLLTTLHLGHAMRCTHAPLRPLLLYFDRPGRSDRRANPNPTDACMHHIWWRRRRCSACAARVGPRARMAPLLTAMHAVPGWSDRWVRTHACSTLDRTCVRSTSQLATSSARLAIGSRHEASASSL